MDPRPNQRPRFWISSRTRKLPLLFFVIGQNASVSPEILQRILREGHLIGNHSYDHSHFGMMHTQAYWNRQIRDTDDLIERTVGHRPELFRPPMGVRTWHITAAARRNGHHVVTWTRRGRDGFNTTPRRILDRLLNNVQAGDILLLHDGIEPHSRRDPTPSVECVRPLIHALRDRGIQPVRLDDLIQNRTQNRQG
jgi:peptidoglycan/xylan/chitin deacetylase (PgdA/CDA1 family)